MKLLPIMLAIMLIVGAVIPGTAVSQTDFELVLRVGMQDDIKGTNPFATAGDHWTDLALQWLYDTPMFFSPETGQPVPYIAIGSANISGRALAWDDCAIGNFNYSPKSVWQNPALKEAIIFYDFENVFWHDGTQMDIRDVMFSYHAAAQFPLWRGDTECLMGANYSADNWLHIDKVWEEGSRAALKFTLQTPYNMFLNRTLAVRLLPEHVWAYAVSGQAVDGARIWCDAGYDRNSTASWQMYAALSFEDPTPVGSGIFKWGSWTKGQWCNITTYREHFFKAGFKYNDYCIDEYGESLAHQPNIDGISYSIYKTSEAAILALKNNDIDYIGWGLPPTFVQELANEPGIALEQSPEQGFTYLAFNMRRESFGYEDGDANKTDIGKPLRKAIGHVIDKNAIAQRLLIGLGISARGPISSISPMFNRSNPSNSFDPATAKQILANAGYKVEKDGIMLTGAEAMAAARDGTWWLNPDGSPIGSSAGGLIEILAPEGNYDPIRAQAGLMIAEQLRYIGIYAEVRAMCFCDIGATVEQRNFDIYIEPCDIDSSPSVFLYDFFHSSNSVDGLNYAGYQNASFDRIIELARSTENGTVYNSTVFEAQASICYDLPYDVLFYRTNIEAYRSDRFVGWGSTLWYISSDSVFNPTSIRLIQGPNPFKLNAQFINPASAMASNTSTPITVLVKDQDGNPVSNARVWLDTSIGTLAQLNGTTGETGKFSTTFTAPWTNPLDPEQVKNGSQAIIQIKEAKYTSPNGTRYDDAPSRLVLIKVYPQDAPFLSVSMVADPDLISPDVGSDGTPGFTYVWVTVTDQNMEPVQGSSVKVVVSPAVPVVEPETQLTDSEGKARFKITATDLPSDDGSEVEYVVKAVALHPTNSNISGENSALLLIIDSIPQAETQEPESEFPAAETAATIVALFIVAFIYAVIVRRRRK